MSKFFAVGTLALAPKAATLEGEPVDFVGRIVSMEDGKVVLRAYDGDEITADQATLKQAVHYDRNKSFFIEVGREAMVFAIDHPAPYIGPNQPVTTSEVLDFDPDLTGFFETRNTVYMANEINLGVLGTITSPWLR